MGAAASISAQAAVSADCKEFISYFILYCPLNKGGKKLRDEAWKVIDTNGNGYVSLAETGKWIKNLLTIQLAQEATEGDLHKGGKTNKSSGSSAGVKAAQDKALLMYKRFYPCYIRAFLDAADIGKNNGRVRGTKTATKDDYVQRMEFRFLCCYLCIYALMYDAFSIVDGGTADIQKITKDDDRRISITELKAAVTRFSGHPLVGCKLLGMPNAYGNTEAIFADMDADGKGMVLLSEWCAWLETKECENNTKLGKLLAKGEEDTK